MQLNVKGKNLEVSESIRSYVERRLQKLDRRVHELTEVEIELAVDTIRQYSPVKIKVVTPTEGQPLDHDIL